MASLRLQSLVLSDAVDLADSMTFPLMTALSVPTAVRGEIRTYAGGRERSVSRRGRRRRVVAALPNCTRAQVAWLEDHLDRLVLARDDRGHKLFGKYFDLEPAEHRYNIEADVQVISIGEITFSEFA
jgi:hypothetical protein